MKDMLGDFELFLLGLSKYHQIKRPNHQTSRKLLLELGSAKLFFYPSFAETKHNILLIPSLINRSYILDLNHNRSLIKHIRSSHNVYLVDFDDPLDSEMDFRLENYLCYLFKMVELIPDSFSILGYCMGGILALGLAERIQYIRKLESLILVATPYDFTHFGLYGMTEPSLKNLTEDFIPAEYIRSIFLNFDLNGNFRKFIDFVSSAYSDEKTHDFISIENWLSDGISMTKSLFQQTFIEWPYRNNLIYNQDSSFKIDPSKIRTKSIITIAAKDNLVPKSSILPLLKIMQNRSILELNTGHIGSVISREASQKISHSLASIAI